MKEIKVCYRSDFGRKCLQSQTKGKFGDIIPEIFTNVLKCLQTSMEPEFGDILDSISVFAFSKRKKEIVSIISTEHFINRLDIYFSW